MVKPKKEFWEVFKKINGALSACEAMFIVQCASAAPKGNYIECGVAFGKSAYVASRFLNDGIFVLVDPHFENEEINDSVYELVRCNEIYPIMKPITSVEALAENSIDYAYAMLDSGDHEQTVIDEVNLIKDRMVSGGIVVMHDIDSQFVRVREAYNHLLNTGNFEEVKFDWNEIEKYVIEEGCEVGNTSWHHPELPHPKFIGALRRK